ncbi:MAG: dihydropteroate synthase [Alphaproteobacteria bacterium]|nr:dihydropteroate synthase [Alphaproteobacteria bacterium]
MTVEALPRSLARGWQVYVRRVDAGPDSPYELILRDRAQIVRHRLDRSLLLDWGAHQNAVVRARVSALVDRLEISLSPLTASRHAPRLMGVLNVTPDSFSDGGDSFSVERAIAHGRRLVDEGADIIDIGGESTRPGASAPPVEVELARVLPVIEALAPLGVPISIDTRRAAVMRAALGSGASIINDVSALTHDPESVRLAAGANVPVVLMHMQGTPETMQRAPHYLAAAFEVFDWLEERIAACEAAGIARMRLIVDPGIGFGKRLDHNLDILRNLSLFRALGCPLLVGASRKGFIGQITGARVPKDRLPGSLAIALHAVAQGADILRVHDVAETRQALSMHFAINDPSSDVKPVAEVASPANRR